jgi:hypothetical protein
MGFRQIVFMALVSLKNTLNDLFLFQWKWRGCKHDLRQGVTNAIFDKARKRMLIIGMSPCLLLEFSSRRLGRIQLPTGPSYFEEGTVKPSSDTKTMQASCTVPGIVPSPRRDRPAKQ